MKKTLIFSFNILTLLIILVLVAGAMGQGSKKKNIWCPVLLDNNKAGSCDNKQACLSACKKRTEPLGVKEINTGCIPGKKCGCYIRCPP
ncbi:hypothetical protein N665_0703s0009 [Sinapis alba]|nr:hypothetical protein N665_0703s0009 [Sinapis alba]